MKKKSRMRLKLILLLSAVFIAGLVVAYASQSKKSFLCLGKTNCSAAPKGVCVKGGACLN